MSLTKNQVWNHIACIERSLGSQEELRQHGYEFARLFWEVGDCTRAIRYLSGYLLVNCDDFRAHKLMGTLYASTDENEKAIIHFKRSLALSKGQKDIVEELAHLYCQLEKPNTESMKECAKLFSKVSQTHPVYFKLLKKIKEMEGSPLVKTLVENKVSSDTHNVGLNMQLISLYCSSGKLNEAFAYCVSLKEAGILLDCSEWQERSLDIAERYYQLLKSQGAPLTSCLEALFSVMNFCQRLFSVLTVSTPSLLSLSQCAALILKFDKVLCACGSSLRRSHTSLIQLILAQNCANLYAMAAEYLLTAHQQQLSDCPDNIPLALMCLLSSVKVGAPETQEQSVQSELKALQIDYLSRTSRVGWMLQLIASSKGDQYIKDMSLWASTTMQERKGCLIRALFSRLSEVKFGSERVSFSFQESFIAADESFLKINDSLPNTDLLEKCTRGTMHWEKKFCVILWHMLVYKALNVESSVLTWVMSTFTSLQRSTSLLSSTDPSTLCAYDVEAFLVLMTDLYSQKLTSGSQTLDGSSCTLASALSFKFPSALSITKFHQQHWDVLLEHCSTLRLSVQNTVSVKKKVQELLCLVRTNQKLEHQVLLGKYFVNKAESSVHRCKKDDSIILELLSRSSFHWTTVSKRLVQLEAEGIISCGEATILEEARMALATEAVYKQDITRALHLYSLVKTSHSAWNQSQIYLQMAGIDGPSDACEDIKAKVENLQQASTALDNAMARLDPSSPKEVKGVISRKQSSIRKSLEEARELAVSNIEISHPPCGFSTPAQSQKPSQYSQDTSSSFDIRSVLGDPLEATQKQQGERILEITAQLSRIQAELSDIKAKAAHPHQPVTSSDHDGVPADELNQWCCDECLQWNSQDATQCTICNSANSSRAAKYENTAFSEASVFVSTCKPNATTQKHSQDPLFPASSLMTSTLSQAVVATSSVIDFNMPNSINQSPPVSMSLNKASAPVVTSASNFPGKSYSKWTCDTCLVSNSYDASQCVACTAKKPSMATEEDSSEATMVPFSLSSQVPLYTGKPSKSGFSLGSLSLGSLSVKTNDVLLPDSQSSGFKISSALGQMAHSTAISSPNKSNLSGSIASTASDTQLQPVKTSQTSGFDESLQSQTIEASFPTTLAFTPAVGSSGHWSCDTCLIQNNHDAIQCVACTAKKPSLGTEERDSSKSRVPFTFVSQAPYTGEQFKTGFSLGPLNLQSFSVKASKMPLHYDTVSQSSGCQGVSLAVKPCLPSSSVLASLLTVTASSTAPGSSVNPVLLNIGGATTIGSKTSSILNTQSEGFKFTPSLTSPVTSPGIFKFGSSGNNVDPLPLTTEFSAATTFGGSGVTLGNVLDQKNPSNQPESSFSDHEPDVYFKPLVSLPDTVEICTGEEKLKVLFENRAKLFRFDSKSSEWKERGIGQMKIVVDEKLGKYRVLMRREQVKNICCNHYICPSMSLSPLPKCERAWIWYTHNDFSDCVSKPERFAVKFKLVEQARSFKDCFEDAVTALGHHADGSCSESESDSTDSVKEDVEHGDSESIDGKISYSERCTNGSDQIYDEVQFINEKLPSADDIQLAKNYLLPIAFFNYKSKPDCPGCRGCLCEDTSKLSVVDSFAATAVLISSNTDTKASVAEPSFSQLASTSRSWFLESKKSSVNRALAGAGTPLFESKHSPDSPEAEADLQFTPLVTLPDVDLRSGEEDEEVVFVHRAKLYRFDVPCKQWKERGVGEIKILRNSSSLKSRIVMRRDQIKKLCCNHFITTEVILVPKGDSETSWVWFTNADFSDSEVKAEKFAVKFKLPETALKFKVEFEKSKSQSSPSKAPEHAQKRAYTPPGSAGEIIVDSTGTLENYPSFDAATVCSPDSSTNRNPLLRFPLNMTPTMTLPYICPKPVPALTTEGSSAVLSDWEAAALKTAPEDGCEDVIFVREDLPPKDLIQKAESLLLPPSFYLYLNKDPCDGCRGCVDKSQMTLSTLKSRKKMDENNPKSLEEGKPLVPTEPQPSQFFQTSEQLSFSDLKQSSPMFGAKDPQFKFQNAGSLLFSAHDENPDIDEEADCDAYFKPLVSLPEVTQSDSWDKNASPLFVGRGKLYRYDDSVRQWKERGIGEIKIMQHNETTRSRVIMRRDQVLKLCCNHYITPDMHLLPGSSEKSWIWSTQSDFTEEKACAEKLAVRFKHIEVAEEFKKVFDSCVSSSPQ